MYVYCADQQRKIVWTPTLFGLVMPLENGIQLVS